MERNKSILVAATALKLKTNKQKKPKIIVSSVFYFKVGSPRGRTYHWGEEQEHRWSWICDAMACLHAMPSLLRPLVSREMLANHFMSLFVKCGWLLPLSSVDIKTVSIYIYIYPCMQQGSWSLMILEISSSPSHSMILWFYDIRIIHLCWFLKKSSTP